MDGGAIPIKGKSDSGLSTSDFSFKHLIENVTAIYGSGMFYDKRSRKFVRRSDLDNAAGNDVVREYLKNEHKQIVHAENVVFDPGSINPKPGYINLFEDFSLAPKAGECKRLIELHKYLCDYDDVAFKASMRWYAIALQRPGAKMRHALVYAGPEGSGKNLALSALLKIYGPHGTIINQDQLDSQFNGYMSRRLLVCVNEAVARKHLFERVGILKNLITEDVININEKNQPLRQESNHANFVFFSNTNLPVAPDTDDRRFMVIRTPPKRDKSFYRDVATEMASGGVEAFYHYLMNYDLGGFDEYTEPLFTKAKDELIELAMKSDQRFIRRWISGDIGIDVIPCKTDDLYKAYKKWCAYEGEKFHVTSTEFGFQLGRCKGLEKKTHQHYWEGQKDCRATFVYPSTSEQPGDIKKADWLTHCIKNFRLSVAQWRDRNGEHV